MHDRIGGGVFRALDDVSSGIGCLTDYWQLGDVADHFLFFCWTDLEKQKVRDHSGMSCFIVERSMTGFSSGTLHGKLGIRAGNTG